MTCLGEHWVEKLAGEDGLEDGQHYRALLAGHGQVPSDPTEGPGTGVCTEAAGDFLLDFERPEIALSLVVVERNA